jgi:hypothetical protein
VPQQHSASITFQQLVSVKQPLTTVDHMFKTFRQPTCCLNQMQMAAVYGEDRMLMEVEAVLPTVADCKHVCGAAVLTIEQNPANHDLLAIGDMSGKAVVISLASSTIVYVSLTFFFQAVVISLTSSTMVHVFFPFFFSSGWSAACA